MRLKLELDEDTTARLVERVAAERRPVPWQAEVLLRQALGFSFPQPYQGGQGSEVEDSSQRESTAGADS